MSPYTYFMDLSPDGCYLLFAHVDESSKPWQTHFFLHHLPSGTAAKIPASPLFTKLVDNGLLLFGMLGGGIKADARCGQFSPDGKFVTCNWYMPSAVDLSKIPDPPTYLPGHNSIRTTYEIATQQIWDEPSTTACDAFPKSEYALCGSHPTGLGGYTSVYNSAGTIVPIAWPQTWGSVINWGIVGATKLIGLNLSQENYRSFQYHIPTTSKYNLPGAAQMFASKYNLPIAVSADFEIIRLSGFEVLKKFNGSMYEEAYFDPGNPQIPLAISNTSAGGPFTKDYIIHAHASAASKPLTPGTPVVAIEKMVTKQKLPLLLAQDGDNIYAAATDAGISADGRIIAIFQYKEPYVVRVIGNPFMSNP